MRASRSAGDNERCVHKKLLYPRIRTTETTNAETRGFRRLSLRPLLSDKVQ